MNGEILFVVFLLIAVVFAKEEAKRTIYTPDWKSLDSRPLPSWYDESKFGIFVSWGLYSVPGYGCTGGGLSGEWYWWVLDGDKKACLVDWHQQYYGKNFKYEDFAPLWKASMFNPDEWAKLFSDSGAKYVVFISKHHDGFTNWRSPESWNWNSVDAGPGQDNVALVTNAVRKAGLRMGLYHSLFEWFNPLYLADRASGGNTTVYVNTTLWPQLKDIVNTYKPDIVWSDGDWEMPDTYWKSKEFLAWLYNDSPVKDTVVSNDRWGAGDTCKHGGFWACLDRHNPGKLMPHKWENVLTIDSQSWGYRKNAGLEDMLTIEELLYQLVSTVSCGGNMLLNVGPTSEGFIIPVFTERLLQIGAWLKVNGDSIYATIPWRSQNDTAADVWYTSKGSTVYAILLSWPKNNNLVLTQPKPNQNTGVDFLGYGPLKFTNNSYGSLTIALPSVPISLLPNPYAWAFALTNVM
jgi:alpha-L-fucosidase